MPLCPSCGREVGSRVTCPYCGANLKRRLTISLFGFLAILLAAGVLALLYVVAVNTPIPAIRIGQIQAAMNYAYVHIEGSVARLPTFNPDSESLTFWVDDGTGRLPVSAFRSEARALIQSDRVPSLGDRVTVEGLLRVREDVPSLTLNSADALILERAIANAPERDLGSILASDAATAVTVRGQARAVREPFGGLRLITLRDGSGEIDVAIDAGLEPFGAPAPQVKVGDSIKVAGVVTLYEGTPQITLTRGDRLSVLSEPVAIAETVSIRKLGDDDIGRWVRVQGTIARIAPFSAGVKFTLSDAQGQDVSLLLWQDVFEALPDTEDWQIGAEVVAQGAVNSFRGELEIVPGISLDVSLLTRAASDAAQPVLELRPIGAIAQPDIGRTVFVSGTVQSVDRFSSGMRFRLEDGTGSILLVLFDAVLTQVEDNQRLAEGVAVSALGRVSEFNGALEVIPPNGASVRVAPALSAAQVTPTPEPLRVTLAPEAAPTETESGTLAPSDTPRPTPGPIATSTPAPGSGVTAIASIDRSLIETTVSVRGQVISTSSFSAGFRFKLNDGAGSIDLILFDGNYRELPDSSALNLGAQVKVTARIVEFNGELQLQPASGADVVVERRGSSSIVKTRAIDTVSAADIGSLVAVVGEVIRVEGFSAGVRVFVNDGTGEMLVIVFDNVLSYVPNALSLQAGARLRVAGRVGEFNGALELVPALGYDVTLNP